MKFYFIITLLLINAKSYSQKLEDYTFEKYKTPQFSTAKNAKINYASNPTASGYRTNVSYGYNSAKPTFASYYVTSTWGCGGGCITGVMIDVRDGKVYDLPINEDTSYNGCFSQDISKDDRYKFQKDSGLLITSVCSEISVVGTDKYKDEKEYFIFIWDETKKKFNLIKKIKKIVSEAH